MADWTLAVVRKIMNWQASRSDDFRSPIVRGMASIKPKERARERRLAMRKSGLFGLGLTEFSAATLGSSFSLLRDATKLHR